MQSTTIELNLKKMTIQKCGAHRKIKLISQNTVMQEVLLAGKFCNLIQLIWKLGNFSIKLVNFNYFFSIFNRNRQILLKIISNSSEKKAKPFQQDFA